MTKQIVERASAVVRKWFPVFVLLAGGVALLNPAPFAQSTAAIPWLLALIMLGMGMTLKGSDFAIVAKRPWALLLGVATQYAVMPLLAYGLAKALGLPPALAAGLVLVGAAPGGTASNVIVYLSRGDIALSVSMTTFSTLLAPLLTPILVLLLAGEFLPIDAKGLFTSIVQIVLAPVIIGLLLRTFAAGLVERILPALPIISVAGITAAIAIVIGANADTVLTVGLLVIVAVVLHNGLGLALGYGIARACGLNIPGRRAVSIEVGMQNSGLAAALAATHFNPVAALPAAIFSIWHNISGPALASYWARRTDGMTPAHQLSEGAVGKPLRQHPES